MTPTTRRRAGALAAVAAGILTACSSTASSSPSSTQAPATTTTIRGASTPAQTRAAALRAQVTALTTANVYLTSVATSADVSGTDPAPALAAVDSNSHALADIFGAPYAKLYSLWAQQTPLYVAYVQATVAADRAGVKAADSAGVKQAKTGLDTWRQQLEAYLAKANAYVIITQSGAQVLDDDLAAGVQGMLAVLDAQATKSPTQYDKLVAAAATTPHLATQLAAALAKQLPAQYPGTAVGTAANLRASLTTTLVSHAYLLGITTATAIGGGDLAPTLAAVQGNGRELANAFGSVYGDAVGQRLDDLWTSYVGSFVDYARAAASGDSAAKGSARAQSQTFQDTFAVFASRACPKLIVANLTREFANHIDSQAALVDAQAAHQPAQFDLLRRAGNDMPGTAEILSEGIAEQFPLKYLP